MKVGVRVRKESMDDQIKAKEKCKNVNINTGRPEDRVRSSHYGYPEFPHGNTR